MPRIQPTQQQRAAAERVKAAEAAASQVHEHVLKWMQRRAKKRSERPAKS